ncbi:MAG: Glu/Leu/Phe/Val dehydrogenase dimerization domain-containing protein [Planctomycetota bacterium]|nr:Glu/Leu/Phe/Val dehydrogenase dimerization domain-containing protein [Planctomycetota bacterium]
MKIRQVPVDGYEHVAVAEDEASGLHAIVAIHDTSLGPALGGLRMWDYESEQVALTDVLRLAKGMTYKSACANTGLGGGKAVIIGDQETDKTEQRFRAMGRFIETIGGRYITAEDVGIGIRELEWLGEETKYVTGLSRQAGSSGNPSPFTARGVIRGLFACTEEKYGTSHLDRLHYSVQGLGQVGGEVVRCLSMLGATVTVSDISDERCHEFVALPGVEVVSSDDIYEVDCDVFMPCAMGGVLNEDTIPRLRAQVVAGCANNQLLRDEHGKELHDRGILYAPDFIINAGGIINVSVEVRPEGYNERFAVLKIENIYNGLREVFDTARRENLTPAEAADQVAENRLREARKRNGNPLMDAASNP